MLDISFVLVLVVAPLLLAVVAYGSILDDYLYTYRNILYKFEEEREERRNTKDYEKYDDDG